MSSISWFEIPTKDIERAQKFYEAIFQTQLVSMDAAGFLMRIFPVEDMMKDVSGALVYNEEFYACSDHAGSLIYLNANPDVQNVLDRVEAAGGSIIVPKTEISPEHGFMGIILDTEGNRIGLHSIPVQ